MSAKDLLRRLLRPWQQPASPTGDPSRSLRWSVPCEGLGALDDTRRARTFHCSGRRRRDTRRARTFHCSARRPPGHATRADIPLQRKPPAGTRNARGHSTAVHAAAGTRDARTLHSRARHRRDTRREDTPLRRTPHARTRLTGTRDGHGARQQVVPQSLTDQQMGIRGRHTEEPFNLRHSSFVVRPPSSIIRPPAGLLKDLAHPIASTLEACKIAQR